jgi:hypothetical protein
MLREGPEDETELMTISYWKSTEAMRALTANGSTGRHRHPLVSRAACGKLRDIFWHRL